MYRSRAREISKLFRCKILKFSNKNTRVTVRTSRNSSYASIRALAHLHDMFPIQSVQFIEHIQQKIPCIIYDVCVQYVSVKYNAKTIRQFEKICTFSLDWRENYIIET